MKVFILFLAIAIIGIASAGRPECVGVPMGQNVAFPGDCRKFIQCIGGGVTKQCPSPLTFNPKKKVCDWEESSNCPAPIVARLSKLAPPPPPTGICTGLLGRQIPHPLDCNKYYVCDTLIGTLMRCPPGEHFNRWLQMCDTPFSANCIITY